MYIFCNDALFCQKKYKIKHRTKNRFAFPLFYFHLQKSKMKKNNVHLY